MNHQITRAAAGAQPATMTPAATAARSWSILLTSTNHGTVGPLGSTFPHAGEKHERVQVVEIVEAGTPPAPGVDLAGLIRFDAAGNQVLLGRPDPAFVAEPVQPVGEFQGYVDGEPFVAWVDRTRMPQVGDKLYAGAAPVAAQAGQVAVPQGWSVERVGDAIHIKRADGKWCGYMPEVGPAAALTFEFVATMLAAAPSAPAVAQQALVHLSMLTRYYLSTAGMQTGPNGRYVKLADVESLFGGTAQAHAAQPQSWRAIGPLPVERDRDGSWTHPAIPDFDEDARAYKAWLAAVGLEVTYKMLESEDDSHPVYVSYFEKEESSFSGWEPTPPAGEGWFTFSIHDTEDGPAWVWARRIAAQASTAGGRQEGGE